MSDTKLVNIMFVANNKEGFTEALIHLNDIQIEWLNKHKHMEVRVFEENNNE